MKTYNFCNLCNNIIYRGGVEVSKKQGFGYSHNHFLCHKACLRKHTNNQNLISIAFKLMKKVKGFIEVDLDKNTLN